MKRFGVILLVLPLLLTGCSSKESEEKVIDSTQELLESVDENLKKAESFSAVSLFTMEGEFYDDSQTAHSFSVLSEINEDVYLKRLSILSETYSKTSVDGNSQSEIIEQYFVPADYGTYEHYMLNERNNKEGSWVKKTVSKKNASGIIYNSGYISSWSSLSDSFDTVFETVETEEGAQYVLSGTVDKEVLSTLLCVDIMDGFYQQLLQLLSDEIPLTLVIDSQNLLPVEYSLELSRAMNASDIQLTAMSLSHTFSSFNRTDEITVPKKISVTSEKDENEVKTVVSGQELFSSYLKKGE